MWNLIRNDRSWVSAIWLSEDGMTSLIGDYPYDAGWTDGLLYRKSN